MTAGYRRAIAPAVNREIALARQCLAANQAAAAFHHLENAHVLGQPSTLLHVNVHCHMLAWAIGQGDLREGLGQLVRIVGAAGKTALGLVPSGNTGGSNVSPLGVMPIAPELAQQIAAARKQAGLPPDA